MKKRREKVCQLFLAQVKCFDKEFKSLIIIISITRQELLVEGEEKKEGESFVSLLRNQNISRTIVSNLCQYSLNIL